MGQKYKWAEADIYKRLIDTSPSAIVIVDEDDKLISWNESAVKIFGHSQNEALGQSLHIIIPKIHRDAHDIGINRVRNGGRKKLIGKLTIIEALHKEGHHFDVQIALSDWSFLGKKYYSAIINQICSRPE